MKIDYSIAVTNREQTAKLIVPQPKWHELLYRKLVDVAWSCVLPAALSVLAWLLWMMH